MENRKDEISFRDILDIFIPKLWIVVICAIVFGAAASFYAIFMKDDTFTSKTTIHIVKDTSSAPSSTIDSNDIYFVQSALPTYVSILSSKDTVDKAINHLKTESEYKDTYTEKDWDKITTDEIMDYIKISSNNESLTIDVTSPDPKLSCAVAQSMAYLVEKENITAYPEGTVSTLIYQKATESEANSHNVVTTALVGVFAGALLAMAVIFIINLADVTIHDKKKIEDNFDIPVLGVIPRYIEEGNSK